MSAFTAFQRLVPQHGLSRLVGRVAASELAPLRAPFVHLFAKAYNVNLQEAARTSLSEYRSFNDFFTRELREGARPVTSEANAIASPSDGAVSQIGRIERGELLQAKGVRYSFEGLAAEAAHPDFEGGAFVTIYLAPSDYHRVHLPMTGTLHRSVAVPGDLYSVNSHTEEEIPGLFQRNERLVTEWHTDAGRVLVILVGAMIVASIQTVWGGPASPYRMHEEFTHSDIQLERGDEIGRFLLGSTVILCFEKGRAELDDTLQPGTVVQMGQSLGVTT